MIDACAVALRFAAATLSRDTLRSGPFTVGRAEAREIAVRTSTIPIHVAAMPKRQRRTKREPIPSSARRPRPRRPPSRLLKFGYTPRTAPFTHERRARTVRRNVTWNASTKSVLLSSYFPIRSCRSLWSKSLLELVSAIICFVLTPQLGSGNA